MYKIFYVLADDNDQCSFTKEELEALVKEAYDNGYADGKKCCQNAPLINYPPGVKGFDPEPRCNTNVGEIHPFEGTQQL